MSARRHAPRRASARGLTLVEVLLAVVILGLGIAGMVAAGARCIGVARQARNYQHAREALAQVEAEHPIQIEEDVQRANDSGSLSDPYDGFRWERTVEEVGVEEDTLFKVTTTVSWSDAGKESREMVVTYTYRPDQKGAGTAVR